MRAKSELRAKEEETIALRKRNIELIGLMQVWSARPPRVRCALARARQSNPTRHPSLGSVDRSNRAGRCAEGRVLVVARAPAHRDRIEVEPYIAHTRRWVGPVRADNGVAPDGGRRLAGAGGPEGRP